MRQRKQRRFVDGTALIPRAVARPSGLLLVLFALSLSACDSGGKPQLAEVPTPPDTGAVDSTPTVPDTLVPPPDTLVPPPPPPDSGPSLPPHTPVHVGIFFGPSALPSGLFGPKFTGTYRPSGDPAQLMTDLEAARQSDSRIVLNLTGNEHWLRDDNGFNLAKWKQRVDRFRAYDISSYIADGTIVAHFILDEPTDKTNWKGHQVSLAAIDSMAQYSKQIWPTLPTVIRGPATYLAGYQYKYLDAAWAHYVSRFGPIDQFIAQNIQLAHAAGLGFVTGLNVLNGGTSESGIPGQREGKWAMNASQIRTWGGALLSQPSICGFIMWRYDTAYFARPDIAAAVADLEQQAKNHAKNNCRP